jgi:hypothetical protein
MWQALRRIRKIHSVRGMSQTIAMPANIQVGGWRKNAY